MSMTTLISVYDEVRRLAIAGSAVAGGDFRLKKLVAPLEQAGAKSPVFTKVAVAVEALVDSTDKSAAPALLELTTLVTAILYTQGETGATGPLSPITTTDLELRATQTPARLLKPLLEALTTTGSGRVEIIRDAIDRDLFRDLRLVTPAVRAIDDPYPEIADLIVARVLPMYGTSILPTLRADFNPASKATGQQRRLKLMHDLDPDASRGLVEKCLEEGSKEMKVAAIECLGGADADIGYLLEHSRAKAKDVRSAALRALLKAPRKSVESMKSLLKAIEGDDLELIIDDIVTARVGAVDDAVIEQATKQLDVMLKEKDAKKLAPAISRMMQLVTCLDGRTDAGAEKLLLQCLDKAPRLSKLKGTPAGADLNEVVAFRLCRGSTEMQKRLAATSSNTTGPIFSAAVQAARQTQAPADFFAAFSPLLDAFKSKKRGSEVDRAESLESCLGGRTMPRVHGRFGGAQHGADALGSVPLDPRWVDAAVDLQRTQLVVALVSVDHARATAYLAERVSSDKTDRGERFNALTSLVQIQHPSAADLIIGMIERLKAPHDWSTTYTLKQLIPQLPPCDAPKLDEFLTRLAPDKVDEWIEPITELKRKAE